MIAEDTYKTKNQEFHHSPRFCKFGDFQKLFKT